MPRLVQRLAGIIENRLGCFFDGTIVRLDSDGISIRLGFYSLQWTQVDIVSGALKCLPAGSACNFTVAFLEKCCHGVVACIDIAFWS